MVEYHLGCLLEHDGAQSKAEGHWLERHRQRVAQGIYKELEGLDDG